MLRKIKNALGLVADLTPGVMTVLGGLAVMIGGTTGVLWH